MNALQPAQQNPFAALRGFARPRPPAEPCELCSAALAPEHPHLVEPPTRRLLCCCDACAILFSRDDAADLRFRRVPRDVWRLDSFRMTDAQWDALLVPINVAFFYRSTPAGRVVALYPSPAGATESQLTLDAWDELVRDNPVLRDLEPDVEALLVNRLGEIRAYYRAPIDQCYRLVGLVRLHWRGLSGGNEVWQEIAAFFATLRARARATGARTDA